MYTLVLEQTMRDLLTFVFKKVETEDDKGHRKLIDTAYHWDKDPTDYLAFVHALANDETITRLHFTFHNYVHYNENPSLRELTIPRRSSDTLYSDCLDKFDEPFAYIVHNRSEIHIGGLVEESYKVSLGGIFDEMYQTTRYGFMWEADGENVFYTKTFCEMVRFIEDNKKAHTPSKCIDDDIYPKISTVNSICVIRLHW